MASTSDSAPAGTSGKAIASLVCGLLAFCTMLPGLPGLILGILSLGDINRSGGRLGGKGLAIGGIIASVLGTLFSCGALFVGGGVAALGKVREAAGQAQTGNSLRQIGLAMHMYHDQHGTLPPPAKRLSNGQRGLSWRVMILPYLDQDAVYRQFHIEEPWDSPHNKALLGQMPTVYNRGGTPANAWSGNTPFQVFVGPGSAFEDRPKPITFMDFKDGTSNTLLVVEAQQEVPWTKPDDLPFDPARPLPPLGLAGSPDFWLVYGDGSIKRMPTMTPETQLKALITREGGEVIVP